MENAVLALAQIENSATVKKAIAHYDQQMRQKLQLPTDTLQELLDLHRASKKRATEFFLKNSFKDVDQLFQKELAVFFFLMFIWIRVLESRVLLENEMGIIMREGILTRTLKWWKPLFFTIIIRRTNFIMINSKFWNLLYFMNKLIILSII